MTADNGNFTFLLQQLQQGSEVAFSKIYDHFSKQLYRNILYLVKDEDVAQEILQDLFVKLWEIRIKLDPQKTLKPYLFKMASSLVYNYYRKVAQDQRLINQLIITTSEHITSIEDKIIDNETWILLQRAVEQLPPQRKQVFMLCKYEGKSYNEVAEALSI